MIDHSSTSAVHEPEDRAVSYLSSQEYILHSRLARPGPTYLRVDQKTKKIALRTQKQKTAQRHGEPATSISLSVLHSLTLNVYSDLLIASVTRHLLPCCRMPWK